MEQSANLPLILAGPILRRVEPARVCVWVATSQAVRVTGIVYNGSATQQLGEGIANTLALGKRLHAAVVEITPPKGSGRFNELELMAYDLILEVLGTKGKPLPPKYSLKDLITASNGSYELPYELASSKYPTFFMGDETLNILHGSCRKAHGLDDDALTAADELLQRTAPDLSKRPSSLFLTGDQIYADDVDDSLIRYVVDLGRYVIGFSEKVPDFPNPDAKDPAQSPLRLAYAKNVFSPDDDAKNQLIRFGDFVGLYLLALNEKLWPGEPENGELKNFFHALPRVRKVFANIATYMTLDDHELTDDWNISKQWEARAQSPFGRRVIANALCAYWVFQGWGNDPDAFDAKFRAGIETYFAEQIKQASPGTADARSFEATLLGQQSWFFIAPTTPKVFFLDARTRERDQASQVGDTLPTALIGDNQLQLLHTKASEEQRNDRRLVIVAQTPVFGVPKVEANIEWLAYDEGLLKKAKAVRKTSFEYLDLDRWHANRSGYYKLLRILHDINPKGCFILSGDVHYAFVARATVTIPGKAKDKEVDLIQFTSSALKNKPNPDDEDNLLKAPVKADIPFRLYEHGWLKKLRDVSPRTPRARDILAAEPIVLTEFEFQEVSGIKPQSWDTTILKKTIRPTTPSDGPCVHIRSNLGQLILTPEGKATLRLYPPNSKDPFAVYELQVPEPPVPPIPKPMRILFEFDQPTSDFQPKDLKDITVFNQKPGNLSTLKTLKEKLSKDKTLNVHLTGMASSEGDEKHNYYLGKRRALWLAAYLEIDMSRIGDPPDYAIDDKCQKLTEKFESRRMNQGSENVGIVSCGAAHASPSGLERDRCVEVTFFRPS